MATKNPCQGKHKEFWKSCQNTGKTQGICFAQVVNFLILKVKDISIFDTKISKKISKLDKSAKCLCNSHKSRKLAQGKFANGQRKNRENTENLKMQFQWVPCKSELPPNCENVVVTGFQETITSSIGIEYTI